MSLKQANQDTESLSGLDLPECPQTGQREDYSSKQAKGRKFPTLCLLAAWGWGVSFSDAPPLFLWQGREGLALSQTGCMRRYLTKGPMGIIPSGMIPHWESTATSIQHIQVSCSRRKGFRAKRGNMGAAIWHQPPIFLQNLVAAVVAVAAAVGVGVGVGIVVAAASSRICSRLLQA